MPFTNCPRSGTSPYSFSILSSKSLHFSIAHNSSTASLFSLLEYGTKVFMIKLAMEVISVITDSQLLLLSWWSLLYFATTVYESYKDFWIRIKRYSYCFIMRPSSDCMDFSSIVIMQFGTFFVVYFDLLYLLVLVVIMILITLSNRFCLSAFILLLAQPSNVRSQPIFFYFYYIPLCFVEYIDV